MLYRRGRIWWIQFEHNGARRYLSTGQTDRRLAEKEARRLRVEVEATEPAGTPGRPTGITLELLEALDIARAENEGLSAARQRTIEGLWSPMHRLLGPKANIAKATIGDVLEFVGQRKKEGCKGQTIKREVEALVRALKIAKRDKIIVALPFDPDDLPRIKSDPPKAAQKGKLWADKQIADVLDNLSTKAVTAGHRDRCKLVLLTGLRSREVERLQRDWVEPIEGYAPVVAILHVPPEGAKWNRARDIPLVQEAVDIIERCAPFSEKHKIAKALAVASEKAGLSGVLTLRDLRTTFLTKAGASDPVAAQHLGGHSNIATTGIYLRTDLERARKATLAAVLPQGPDNRVLTEAKSTGPEMTQKANDFKRLRP